MFVQDLRRHKVSDVVRVCEPSYDPRKLCVAGINFLVRALPSLCPLGPSAAPQCPSAPTAPVLH